MTLDSAEVCARCGYDRRATPAGAACPECGEAAPAETYALPVSVPVSILAAVGGFMLLAMGQRLRAFLPLALLCGVVATAAAGWAMLQINTGKASAQAKECSSVALLGSLCLLVAATLMLLPVLLHLLLG